MRKVSKTSIWLLAATLSISFPCIAYAHIKWFAPYDTSEQPLPPNEVLSSTFVGFFVASAVLIYVFFLVDRYGARKGVFAAFDKRLKMFNALGVGIMRVAGGVFFLSIWAYGYAFGVRFYLTPELVTDAFWVPWVQVLTGLATLHRRTVPLTFPGIVALAVGGVAQYGLYHMLDYIIFLAIGYFYVATASNNVRWVKSGFITLYAVTGINFLWLAVEKFAYPQWTYRLLEKHPDLLMGLDQHTYMILAGFVEFMMIFTLLGAASVVTRLVAFAFQILFILAIFMFGLIDAIGHLMIIAILFVLVVRGPTDARSILVLDEKSLQMEAYFMTGLYYFAVVNAFILYYGLHYLLVAAG